MKECRAVVVDDAANIAFVITPEALIVPDTARYSLPSFRFLIKDNFHYHY